MIKFKPWNLCRICNIYPTINTFYCTLASFAKSAEMFI